MTKRTVKSGGILLVLICLIYLGVWYNRRPDVSLERLMVDNPAFPVQWTTEDMLVTGINWQVSERLTIADSSILSPSNARRVWSDHSYKDTCFTIEQLTGNYQSPFLAWVYDTLFPLERAHREEWGNLLSDELSANRYPSNWSYKSATADKEYVVCAEGTPSNCYIWLYRARYGQYAVFIEFNTLSKGSNADTFAQIVAQIDGHMSRQLGK